MSSSSSYDPVVIVGAGPAGLTAAIESAKKGYSVKLFENREFYVRPQRVSLHESYDYLQSVYQQLNVVTGIPENEIKIMRKFMYELSEYRNVQIKDLQKFLEISVKRLYPNKVKIERNPSLNIQSIDGKNQTLTYDIVENGVKKTVQQNFSHFAAADGGKRAMLKLLAENDNKYNVEIRALENQTRQVAHGTLTLSIRNRTSAEILLKEKASPRELTYKHMDALVEAGWDKPYLPAVVLWPTKEHTKWYIAGEIPDAILTELDKEKQAKMLEKWGQTLLSLAKGIPTDWPQLSKKNEEKLKDESHKVYVQEKEKLRATAFPVTLTYAVDPCVQLGDGVVKKGVFVVLGDGSKSANIHLGQGANDGIGEGRFFGECLNPVSNTFNIEDFRGYREMELLSMKRGMKTYERNLISEYEEILKGIKKEIGEIKKKLEPSEISLAHELKQLTEHWYKIKQDILSSLQPEVNIWFEQEIELALNEKNVDKLYLTFLRLSEEVSIKNGQPGESANLLFEAVAKKIDSLKQQTTQVMLIDKERKREKEGILRLQSNQEKLQQMVKKDKPKS